MEVTKTSENELLIHKLDGKGGRLNIIVDAEGEIEVMYIGPTGETTWNRFPVTLDEALQFWNFFGIPAQSRIDPKLNSIQLELPTPPTTVGCGAPLLLLGFTFYGVYTLVNYLI